MAEIVASAVVSEAFSRISTFLVDRYERRSSEGDDDIERLEMAHIRMEAALEASGKWPTAITDASLLRWRRKLKRAAEECDVVLHRRKRSAMEAKEMERRVRRCSFPARMAHATRSFFSASGNKTDEPVNSSDVTRRYERFADDAGEFLKFVELGSVRRQMLTLDPLVGHLLAGRAFRYEISQGNLRYHFEVRPMCFADRGLEAGVLLHCQEHETNNFTMGILQRVTESTDLIAVVAECLKSFTPHLKPVADIAKQELSRVHTRGFYCYPFLASTDPEYRRLISSESHRARPNPLCCRGTHEHKDKLWPGCAFPEPVIKLFVQRHLSKPSPSVDNSRPLQLTAVFAPHASPPAEEMPAGAKSFAMEVTDGRSGGQAVHTDVGLLELEEMLLPGAITRLAEQGSSHEVFWRSGHGVAYLCVEKTGTDMAMWRQTQWQLRSSETSQPDDDDHQLCVDRQRLSQKLVEAREGAASVPGRVHSTICCTT